jgi:hypothetical protein
LEKVTEKEKALNTNERLVEGALEKPSSEDAANVDEFQSSSGCWFFSSDDDVKVTIKAKFQRRRFSLQQQCDASIIMEVHP